MSEFMGGTVFAPSMADPDELAAMYVKTISFSLAWLTTFAIFGNLGNILGS